MANWLPQASLGELVSLVEPFSHGWLNLHASMISCQASPVAHLGDGRKVHKGQKQICIFEVIFQENILNERSGKVIDIDVINTTGSRGRRAE